MSKLILNQYVVGYMGVNCYVAANKETGECIVIDSGASAQKLAEKIKEDGFKPVAVLLTHGHFDHAGAAEELAKLCGVPVYAHEMERDTLENPDKNVSTMMRRMESYHADIFVKDEEVLALAGFEIQVLYTPGHTEGGCCYYLPEENVLFSGDTLFAQSVGRTDFPGGSMSQLVRSIREKLAVLPEDTRVYPGHNEETSIGLERIHNPYL